MPTYEYGCEECRKRYEIVKPIAEYDKKETCENCGHELTKLVSLPAIQGTRDSFGVDKSFYDEKTGQTIDTWKKWEKAGFKPAMESKFKKHPHVKARIKEKIKKITKYDNGNRKSLVMGGNSK